MKKLEELMERQWLVASFDGHAIFWNHANTFNLYAIAPNGDAEALDCRTIYHPDGMEEAAKIRWAIFTGRELAGEYRKDNSEQVSRG